MALRKEFERRTWQVGETFNEYYHDKIIMVNHISIDTNEIIDYVVEGGYPMYGYAIKRSCNASRMSSIL